MDADGQNAEGQGADAQAGVGTGYKAAKARARQQRRLASSPERNVPTEVAAAPGSDHQAATLATADAPLADTAIAPGHFPESEETVSPTAADPAEPNAEESIMDYTAADTATDTAEKVADAGQTVAADFASRTQDAMGRASRAFEEMNAFGKGNVEALVESSKIAVKGFETMGQEAAEFTRKSFEGATAAMRTLAATRSPTEFVKLQGDYARQWFDAVIAETSRSTELALKLANDVAQPISNRVALAAEKVRTAA